MDGGGQLCGFIEDVRATLADPSTAIIKSELFHLQEDVHDIEDWLGVPDDGPLFPPPGYNGL